MHPPVLILLFGVLLILGCSRGPTAVLDLVSRDPGQDHWANASYYTRQATASRQQAEEMTNLAVVYERLFAHTITRSLTRHAWSGDIGRKP